VLAFLGIMARKQPVLCAQPPNNGMQPTRKKPRAADAERSASLTDEVAHR
jgi:hypothetical protein